MKTRTLMIVVVGLCEGSRRVSLGGLFTIGPSITMSLEGAHSKAARGVSNHGVMLRGDLSW